MIVAFALRTTFLNARPVVSGSDFTVTPGRTLFSSGFFSAFDADGTIAAIDIRSPTGFNGFGSANSVDPGNPMVWHIPAFSQFGYSIGVADGNYVLSARAFDGIDWSEWEDVNVTVATPADNAGNDAGNARAVTLNSTVQTFGGWVGAGDGLDYYRFTVNGSERVVIGMGPADYAMGLTVQLRDAQGNAEMPPMSISYGSGASYTTPALEAGDYYLTVGPAGNSSYSLSLSTLAGTPFDGAGNNFADARPVATLHTEQTFRRRSAPARPAARCCR